MKYTKKYVNEKAISNIEVTPEEFLYNIVHVSSIKIMGIPFNFSRWYKIGDVYRYFSENDDILAMVLFSFDIESFFKSIESESSNEIFVKEITEFDGDKNTRFNVDECFEVWKGAEVKIYYMDGTYERRTFSAGGYDKAIEYADSMAEKFDLVENNN